MYDGCAYWFWCLFGFGFSCGFCGMALYYGFCCWVGFGFGVGLADTRRGFLGWSYITGGLSVSRFWLFGVTLVVMWSCALVGVCLGLSFFVGWCGMTLGFASLRLVWRFGFDVGFCGGCVWCWVV